MSPTPRTVLSSPPGQEDQSARLAASADVGQVVDTPTLEQFQRWLSNRAHAARDDLDLAEEFCIDPSLIVLEIEDCRTVFMFLTQFSQGLGPSSKLPIEVPESDTLWRLITGSSLNYMRHGLASGSPVLEEEAKSLRRGAQRVWAQIRAEVGA